MRTLMLALVSDPFHALLFKERLDVIKDEFDQVVVGIAGKIPEANRFIEELYKEFEIPFVVDHHMNQGQIFDKLYPYVKGDVVITMDSDNYVFKKGIISRYAKMVESGEFDLIGSHGQHARPSQFADALMSKYKYVRMNPFMCFIKKEMLDKLDNLTFQSRVWPNPGVYDSEIDWKLTEDASIDHMGVLTIRLIRLGAKIKEIGGESPPEWVHWGAMATAIKHHLCKNDGSASLDGSSNQSCGNHINIGMLGRWYFAWKRTKDKYPDKSFVEEYEDAIKRKARASSIGMEQIIQYSDNIEREWNGYIK